MSLKDRWRSDYNTRGGGRADDLGGACFLGGGIALCCIWFPKMLPPCCCWCWPLAIMCSRISCLVKGVKQVLKALMISLRWYGPAQLGHWREGRLIWARDEQLQDQRAQPGNEAQHDYLNPNLIHSKQWKGGKHVNIHAFNSAPTCSLFPCSGWPPIWATWI